MAELCVLDSDVSPRSFSTRLYVDTECNSTRDVPVTEPRELAAHGSIAELTDHHRYVGGIRFGQHGWRFPSQVKVGPIVRGRIVEPVIDRLKNGFMLWCADLAEQAKCVKERERVRGGDALEEARFGLSPGEDRSHHLCIIGFRHHLFRQKVSAVQFGRSVGKKPIAHTVMSKREPLVVGWTREPDQFAVVGKTTEQAQRFAL
jgi:hypothetical protein